MKRLTLAILGIVVTVSGGCAAEVAPSAASCAVAAAYFADWTPNDGSKALAFGEDGEGSLLAVSADGWFPSGKPEAGSPPKALIDKFNATKSVSAVKYCPGVRAALDRLGFPHGTAAVAKATTKPDYEIENISAPVLSEDGAGVLFVVSSRMSNGLSDRTLQYMRRAKSGQWVIAALHRF